MLVQLPCLPILHNLRAKKEQAFVTGMHKLFTYYSLMWTSTVLA